MLRIGLYLLGILSFIGLTGCATNASVDQMAYHYQGNKQPSNKTLLNGIAVSQVTGGHETNPLWTSQINNENFKQALVRSLQQASLYNDSTKPKYVLSANLMMLDQPIAGFDMTASCQVHYTLRDVKKDKIVYRDDILASYTAKGGDAFLGMERLKKATEGAAKANIRKLIETLYQHT
ncbi:MAG: hypothetical protein K0S11_1227 [Gammaproteobacteria bacterium]|nr:hypothetical protein [Gammaproteobacteria bacterium]